MILITGCDRSGTSLIAGVVSLCGGFGGRMARTTIRNKYGMFENAYIRNYIVKPFFRDIDADSLGQHPLPDMGIVRNLVESRKDALRGGVLKTMRDEGYREGEWFYKDAKICLTWPIWAAAFPDAKWVLVRRKDIDIIKSCMSTDFMKAFSTEVGWQGWIDEHKKRFKEMKDAKLNITEVWPEDLVEGDLTIAQKLVEWCGLDWRESKVQEFIAPKLWKITANEQVTA